MNYKIHYLQFVILDFDYKMRVNRNEGFIIRKEFYLLFLLAILSSCKRENEIDFNTIATAGNSTDFGDTLAAHVATGGSVASSTRGVYSVGYLSGSYVNNIEFITIATTGNGQDFGDLNAAKGYHFRGSICDSTRGLFSGGYDPAGNVQNKIDFITIASTGNATDFGDLFLARRSAGGTSNSIHSIFAGGYLPGVNNTIDRVLIQTTGNAADFGDFFFRTHENSGSSDSHGGLS